MVMMELGFACDITMHISLVTIQPVEDVADWHVNIIFTPPCALGYVE
jgi:hypothetical protein